MTIGYVYLMHLRTKHCTFKHDGEVWKIGRSNNPYKRSGGIAAEWGDTVTLVHSVLVYDMNATEKKLHQLYYDYNCSCPKPGLPIWKNEYFVIKWDIIPSVIIKMNTFATDYVSLRHTKPDRLFYQYSDAL